jgi:RNA polymerase sigma-70 factor, ECF subfamily
VREDLAAEAIRLARVVHVLLPDEPEPAGLLALMLLQHSRRAARVGEGGELMVLDAQDRSRWDSAAIAQALPLVDRALTLRRPPGPYALQAAIAAVHARAVTADETDWRRIAALYRVLVEVSPSPVAELNRAVAVGRANGPAAGLAVADALREEKALARYPHLPAVRADLLEQLGRTAEAAAEFARAAELTANERERALFLGRAEAATARLVD